VSEAAVSDLPSDPSELARVVGERMFSRDAASQMMGMRIEEIGPGTARLSMPVRADMLNGHAICHGGFIFTLADSCFAFACNSRNQNVVASACMIDFLAPAKEGEVLIAEAAERALAGRTGIYDIVVKSSDGRHIAMFRGKSHRIPGEVIDPAVSVSK
jgi:acyl-CoA thioesterase